MEKRDSRHVAPEEIQAAESGQEVDLLAVHRQVLREPVDPAEGTETGPWWFWACAVLALVFGGFYLGRFTGVFAGEEAVHTPVAPRQMMAEIRRAGAPPPTGAAAEDGRTVFSSTCIACHQADGQGTPGLFPPLAGSEYAQGDAARMVRIVLHGLSGPVTVRGNTFNGAMPPWKQLTDAQLAAVITYVRSSFGNQASAVAAADVARERSATQSRQQPWTIAELERP